MLLVSSSTVISYRPIWSEPTPAWVIKILLTFSGFDKTADGFIQTDGVHDFFSDNAGKQKIKTGFFDNQIRIHQPLVVFLDIKIGIDYREVSHFLQKEQMRQTVIKLMITQSDHIRRQIVHNLHGGDAFVFGVNQ